MRSEMGLPHPSTLRVTNTAKSKGGRSTDHPITKKGLSFEERTSTALTAVGRQTECNMQLLTTVNELNLVTGKHQFNNRGCDGH